MPRSRVRAENSLVAADKWLGEAGTTFNAGAPNSSMMCSYLAMFHAARSILYRDGYREKSHYCVARYLESRYVDRGCLEVEWVDLLDHYRELRHRNQYDLNLNISPEEAEDALDAAARFLERMRRL
ncbi:HEPN domain-containing protein [Candidatus Bathyarchaeota archaeon]|nr:HEPN domain-containing protein [Candidatus Bathyarchaeota archaeon]